MELVTALIILSPIILYFTLVPALTFIATFRRSSYPDRCKNLKVARAIPWWCKNVCGGIYGGHLCYSMCKVLVGSVKKEKAESLTGT